MFLGIDHRVIASKHRRALKGMSQRAFSPCLSIICSSRVGDGSIEECCEGVSSFVDVGR